MRSIILLIILINSSLAAQIIKQPDAYKLDQRDLFVIMEYMETEYQVFIDHDSLDLPANLSSVNYYVDINNDADSSNMMDINYLYLQGYHEAKRTSGQLFYLVTQKTIPVGNRKTNIRSSKSVDQYSQLSSIEDLSFGYWQLDTITHRIFIVFRESTKIWNMDNFRVFAGLIANKNIYITKSMNSKDSYLFDYNFKRNKEVFVKLPLSLDKVLYSEPVLTIDTVQIKQATHTLNDSKDKLKENNPKQEMLNYLQTDRINEKRGYPTRDWDSIRKIKRTNLIHDEEKKTNTFNAAIKFSYYPSSKTGFRERKIEYMNYDSLSFTCLKKKKGKASKYVLLKGVKDGILTYSKISLKKYRNYYSTENQEEFVFINVADPYDEKVLKTFKIPYSSKGALPRLHHFFKKKILNF